MGELRYPTHLSTWSELVGQLQMDPQTLPRNAFLDVALEAERF
jgi:hypothetical protein